jgi:hypothetical protein
VISILDIKSLSPFFIPFFFLSKDMSSEQSQEVIDDYEKLLESDEEYNVIIHAGENENLKEIHAHSNILRIRSQYFRTAFSNELIEKRDGKYIFNFSNISPEFFKIILR